MKILENTHKLIVEENMSAAYDLAHRYIIENNKNVYGYIALSDIYYEEDLFQSAIDILDEGLKIVLDNKELLEHKLSPMIELGLNDEAKSIINKIISMGETSSNTLGQLGFILSMEGNHEDAILNYNKAIEIDDKDNISVFNLGVSYRALYLYDEAIHAFNKALMLSDADRKHAIVRILKNVKSDKEKSIFNTDKLIPFPGNPDIFNLLVPSNFDAKLKNNVLNITSPDNKIAIKLSYSNGYSDEDIISKIFKEFKGEIGDIYSVIRPYSISRREQYNDLYASSIFITKAKKQMFHAMSILYKDSKMIILTLTSSIFISNKLIDLTLLILESLYFKD